MSAVALDALDSPLRASDDSAMPIDAAEIEGIAGQLLHAAGYDATDTPSAKRLAERLLGAGCIVRTPPGFMRAPAAHGIVAGRPVIHLRGRLDAEAERFLILHEVAEWNFRREGYRGEDIEDACDAIAAALVAPRRAFASVLRDVGPNYSALADAFVATESLCALRVGEVTGEPLALVTPARVRVRGQFEFNWGTEADVRALARSRRPGLRKTKLRDDPRRVVLVADVS